MDRKGSTWNESEIYSDALTLRRVRRVTTRGYYNATPTYHTNTAFTSDGEFFVFASARGGRSAVFRCHTKSGDITQLIDPVDGTGCVDEMQKSSGHGTGNGMGISMLMCVAPKTRWLVYLAGRAVRAVHLETLEERELVRDWGREWVVGVPSIDPEETHVILPLVPAHPELLAGKRVTRNYMDAFAPGEFIHRLVEAPLKGGPSRVVYEVRDTHCAHCPHCPIDPDLLLVDRDMAPKFWGGSDGGKTNRIWTLKLSTKQLTELLPLEKSKFQMHAGWTFDGQGIFYHGPRKEGGYYIGVTRPTSEVIREYSLPAAHHYGHVSAMAGRPAIILDGNVTPDTLFWLYYDAEQPRLEMIARHNTNWNGMPWQYSHPHPQSDPTGKWISFNSCIERGRADAFVVAV
ncbi:MAG TPA: hypothetical protein VEJ63_19735 [Planctomycetota bacterium]|nr:hypothetical protein [Planctomycetota bacterium]